MWSTDFADWRRLNAVHPTIWGDFEMPDGIGIYGGMAPMRPFPRLDEAPSREPRPGADTRWAHRRPGYFLGRLLPSRACLRFSGQWCCSRSTYLPASMGHRSDASKNPPGYGPPPNSRMNLLFDVSARFIQNLNPSWDNERALSAVAKYLVSERPLQDLLEGLRSYQLQTNRPT